MLEIDGLNVSYGGEPVVRGFSLTAHDGEVVCLCGDSGCGKTSILKAVLGFVDYEGSVRIDGKEMTERNMHELRRLMAYVPQEFVMPHETVKEMVGAVVELATNAGAGFSQERLMAEWEKLKLDESLYERKTSELSGGQRQRIMISLVGLLPKRLLLIDEPTSALDAASTRLVSRYIRTLAQERQMSVLAVTHSDVFAAECDFKIQLQK